MQRTIFELGERVFYTKQVKYSSSSRILFEKYKNPIAKAFECLVENYEVHSDISLLLKNIKPVSENNKIYRIYGYWDQVNRRIELDMKMETFEKLLTNLCHEMSHAMQNYRGDLVATTEGFIWKGKKYISTLNNEDYRNYPWEIDANQNQKLLAQFVNEELFMGVLTLDRHDDSP